MNILIFIQFSIRIFVRTFIRLELLMRIYVYIHSCKISETYIYIRIFIHAKILPNVTLWSKLLPPSFQNEHVCIYRKWKFLFILCDFQDSKHHFLFYVASSLGLTGVCVKRRGWTNSRNFGRIYCYFSSQPETNIWFEIGMIWSPHHSKILNICYKTWSYSNNFSVFEIILIFALWFSSISNSNSKVLNRIVNQVTRAACSQQESGILFGKNSGFLANTSSIWFQR